MWQAWRREGHERTGTGLAVAIRALRLLAAALLIAAPAARAQTAPEAPAAAESSLRVHEAELPAAAANASSDNCMYGLPCDAVPCADPHKCGHKEEDCPVWYRNFNRLSEHGPDYRFVYNAPDRPVSRLRDLVERSARACFANDPDKQHRAIQVAMAEYERQALDHALGLYVPGLEQGIGGSPIGVGAAPFVVQVRYRDSLTGASAAFLNDPHFGARWQARHVCGGTLIARDWVLTAAHCVIPVAVKKNTLAVQLGVTDVSGNGGHQVNVDGAIVHAGYNRGGGRLSVDGKYDFKGDIYHDDIALLHLAPDPGPRSPALAATAPPNPDPVAPDTVVQAVGWGLTGDRSEINNVNSLLRAEVFSVVANADCGRILGYGPVNVAAGNGRQVQVDRVHPGVLCVQGARTKTCSGDSGGPLFREKGKAKILVGIVSWNKDGCAITTADKPGVYTRVSAYLGWIDRARRTPPKPGEVIFQP